jgi:uncharacterized protein YbjT (DUF2867 family)
MSEKILVTGVTGDVGGEVFNRLAGKGFSVTAAARDPAKAESAGLSGADIVLLDYDSPETFKPALAGVDRLFVVPPPLNPVWHDQIRPMIDIAAQSGVRHIVNLSQMCAEEIKDLPLRFAEKYIEDSGIAYTHLRPNWFMQTYSGSTLEGAKGQGEICVPAGREKASFIDMRDIAAVAVAALTTQGHMNRAYTLTGPKALDHYEMAKILSRVTGQNVEYMPVSDEDMRATLKSANYADDSIEMVIVLYQFLREGRLEAVSPDVANILGRQPISFEQYAHDYAESWK